MKVHKKIEQKVLEHNLDKLSLLLSLSLSAYRS